MMAATESSTSTTAHKISPRNFSFFVIRPFCMKITASDIIHEHGMNSVRLSMAACVTPSSRSPSVYCSRNCTPKTPVPLANSHRALLIAYLLTDHLGSIRSFIVRSAIITRAVNCISFILLIFGYKGTKTL